MFFLLLSLVSASFPHNDPPVVGSTFQSLNSASAWTVVNQNRSISIPATVPGDVYGDLMNQKVIGDPFYRFGDLDYRWIALDKYASVKNKYGYGRLKRVAGGCPSFWSLLLKNIYNLFGTFLSFSFCFATLRSFFNFFISHLPLIL